MANTQKWHLTSSFYSDINYHGLFNSILTSIYWGTSLLFYVGLMLGVRFGILIVIAILLRNGWSLEPIHRLSSLGLPTLYILAGLGGVFSLVMFFATLISHTSLSADEQSLKIVQRVFVETKENRFLYKDIYRVGIDARSGQYALYIATIEDGLVEGWYLYFSSRESYLVEFLRRFELQQVPVVKLEELEELTKEINSKSKKTNASQSS